MNKETGRTNIVLNVLQLMSKNLKIALDVDSHIAIDRKRRRTDI